MRLTDADEASTGRAAPKVPFLLLAQGSFLVLVASLALMKDPLSVAGLNILPPDGCFLLTALLWLAALLNGETRWRWHPAFGLLLLYFAALALSVTQSSEPLRSTYKLATQIYLLALPVLAFNLVRTIADLRRVALWWIAAAGFVSSLGLLTLLLFPILGRSPLEGPLHHFGTLPPGPYPRLELTFDYPAMLLNYLTVAIMLLLIGLRLRWIERRTAVALLAATLVTGIFALTPGLGGLLFAIGLWVWCAERRARPLAAGAALIAAVLMPLLGTVLAAITPIVDPHAPFLIHVPALPPLAPAVRLLAWIQAAQHWHASALLGHGIGIDAVAVEFHQPGLCNGLCVTDAHNSFLSLGAQTGIFGVAAFSALIVYVVRQMRCGAEPSQQQTILFGLALAWLSGIAVQGLVGSFEDARHLWVTFGLILSATRLQAEARR